MAIFEQRIQFDLTRQKRTRRWQPWQPSPRPLKTWMILALLTAVYIIWLSARIFWTPALRSYFPPVTFESIALLELAGGLTITILWLLYWWQQRQQRELLPLPILRLEEMYALSPSDFEKYVAQLFRRHGFRVKLRGSSGDMGVDLELTKKNGKRAIVQCKRYKHTVGPKIVRELYGTLIHERAAHAFLITTADISSSACEWAKGKPMTLIDGHTLAQIASKLAYGPL